MRSLISPDRLWSLPIKGKEGNSLWFFSFFLSFLHVLFKSHLAESACIAAFTSPLPPSSSLRKSCWLCTKQLITTPHAQKGNWGFFSTGVFRQQVVDTIIIQVVIVFALTLPRGLIAQMSFTFLLANKAIYNFQCISDASMMRLLRDFQGYVTHNEASEIKKKRGNCCSCDFVYKVLDLRDDYVHCCKVR